MDISPRRVEPATRRRRGTVRTQLVAVSARGSFSWGCILKGRCVDDEAEPHVSGDDTVIGRIDLVDTDLLHPGAQMMLRAEIEHLLGLRDTADVGSGEHLGTVDEGTNRQAQLLRGQSDTGHHAARLEQLEIGLQVDRGADGVEDEVVLTAMVTEEILVAGRQGARGSELLGKVSRMESGEPMLPCVSH